MARTITGTVASTGMNKSCVVTVVTRKRHPLYDKQYNVTKRYNAHDEKNEAKVGDKVMLKEVPPISKTKRWALVEIVEKAPEKK